MGTLGPRKRRAGETSSHRDPPDGWQPRRTRRRRASPARRGARRAAGSFDRFVCKPDDNRRGRAEGEISGILSSELEAAGVSPTAVTRIESEVEAIDFALKQAKPGDIVLVFGDEVSRCWKQIIYFGGRKPLEAAATTPNTSLAEPAPPPAAPKRSQPRTEQHPSANDERAEHRGAGAVEPVEAPIEPRSSFVRDERGVRPAAHEGGD